LIGLVATQLLRSSGCEVLGVDLSAERLGMAQGFGARTVNVGGGGDAVTAAAAWTDGRGADAVLITASAKTDEIVRQAAQMCRKRGRIVLVGVVGLNLRRSDFYEKELTFQVSCSYGPGRYDEGYEQGGQDYPFGLVRWTEQRNFQAVLGAVRSGQLRVDGLVTHRFPIAMAADAYQVVAGDSKAVGVILEYPGEAAARRSVEVAPRRRAMPAACGKPAVAVIGAGNFSKMTMLPALVKTGAAIAYVADLDGAAAGYAARKFGAGVATTDYRQALVDPEVKAVLVAVRHDLHGRFVIEALQAGKHVFVEKPLAMDEAELRRVLDAARAAPDRMVMVGFNRRFSPHARKVKQLLAGRSEPLAMTMTVNAGIIPPNHWVHDPAVGGGRIIGEACHFIDLLAFLAGSKVRTVAATRMGSGVAVRDDKMSISLGFEDGSVGTVNYFANGPRSYPKERLAVFSEGRAMEIDNFRRTVGWGVSGFGKFKTFRQDKGHNAEFAAFVDRVAAGGEPLIPLEELANVTRASSAAVTSAAEERTVDVTKEFAAPAGAGGPSA
jgi:predicted dehydrogenase